MDVRRIGISFLRGVLVAVLTAAQYAVFFVLMFLRSIQVFVANMRRGYSVLERPEAFQNTED